MLRINRYLLKEILVPSSLGLVVYTFLMILQVLLRSADLLLTTDISASFVSRLILYSLPSSLVLSIPMAVLVGVLVGIGRLSGDSETIALNASGVSSLRLLFPIVSFGTTATVLCLLLTLKVLPQANAQLTELRTEALSQDATSSIVPRVAYTGIKGKTLVIFDLLDGYWEGVLLIGDSVEENQLLVAERAAADFDQRTGRLTLQIKNSTTHSSNLLRPESYETLFQNLAELTWADLLNQGLPSIRRGLREATVSDLRTRSSDPTLSREIRILAVLELHKRVGFPVACITFAVVGFPLAMRSSRSGKSSGFAISLLLVLCYYLVFNLGEEAGKRELLPASLAAWLPNITITTLGLILLSSVPGTHTLGSKTPSRIRGFWNKTLHLKNGLRSRHKRDLLRLPHSLSRFDVVLRMPVALSANRLSLLDSYLTKKALSFFLMTLISCTSIFIIADFTDNADDIFRRPQGILSTTLAYYVMRTAVVALEVSPFAVLITFLLLTTTLVRSNEFTALKASGIGVFRIALPLLLLLLSICCLSGWLNAEHLPQARAKSKEYLAAIKGKPPKDNINKHRTIINTDSKTVVHFQEFRRDLQELTNVQIFTYSIDPFRLKSRAFSQKAKSTSANIWLLENWWIRSYTEQPNAATRNMEPAIVDLGFSSSDMLATNLTPEEMSFTDLLEEITRIQNHRGNEEYFSALQLSFAKRVSFPFLMLAMGLIGFPFGLRIGRDGAYSSLGFAILMGMCLVMLNGVMEALSLSDRFPTTLAPWTPVALFTLIGLYFFFGIRS